MVRFEDLAERGRDAAAAGDVEEAAARFDEALALWRGPALAGLSGERSIEPVAVRLEELRLAVMEDRFDAELALGRHGRAVGQLQEAVAEHPLRERLAAQLALALYRSGRQADALRALSRARHTLADELGLDPGPELQQLEAQILSHDRSLVAPERAQRPAAASQPATTVVISSPSAAPASSDPDTDTAAPVLLGRERELAVVDEVLRRAAEGTTGVLLVEGEPGIGKSALLDELARRARRAGFVVAHGQSVEGAMAPTLWPWVEAMRSLLVGERGSPYALTAEAALAEAPLVASLIGSDPTPGEGGAATSPFHLADQIARVVRQICAQVPVLIVIDDLHWADDASLELLPYVVTQLAVTGAVVAGGNRPPDLGDAGALSGALGSIARMAHVRRLSLAGLDADDVAAMMAGVTGQVPSATTAAGMHGRTGGNPFFVTELTALLTSERRPDAGAAAGEAVPEAVRDVVRRRLARLPDRTLDVLAVGRGDRTRDRHAPPHPRHRTRRRPLPRRPRSGGRDAHRRAGQHRQLPLPPRARARGGARRSLAAAPGATAPAHGGSDRDGVRSRPRSRRVDRRPPLGGRDDRRSGDGRHRAHPRRRRVALALRPRRGAGLCRAGAPDGARPRRRSRA